MKFYSNEIIIIYVLTILLYDLKIKLNWATLSLIYVVWPTMFIVDPTQDKNSFLKAKRNLNDWIFLYDIITIHNTMCLYNLLGSWYKILGRKLIIIHSFCVWKNVLNMIIKISLNVNDILILLHLITTITIIALRYFNYIVFIHAYNIHT